MPRTGKKLAQYYASLGEATAHARTGRVRRHQEGSDVWAPDRRRRLEALDREILRVLDHPSAHPDYDALTLYFRETSTPLHAAPASDREFHEAVEIAAHLDPAEAERTVEAVLEALRERLPVGDCAALAGALPPGVGDHLLRSQRRGISRLRRATLVQRVRHHLDLGPAAALRRIRAVYAVLERALAASVPHDPRALLALFPSDVRAVLVPPTPRAPPATGPGPARAA